MTIDVFLLSFATLFVIIDPIGVAPISVGLFTGHDQKFRRKSITVAAVIAFCVLGIFGLIGQELLSAIGISMSAFRISGGILLFITALEILFERRAQRRSAHQAGNDPTVFPLAIPLLAGPGAMTSMILLMEGESGNWINQAQIYVALVLVLLITVGLTISANRFAHKLGETGVQLLNRILGVLLAALAVQFVADGISSYIQGIG